MRMIAIMVIGNDYNDDENDDNGDETMIKVPLRHNLSDSQYLSS